MIQPRWRKVLSDLWSNKTRTLLVVLSISVGIFAIGLVSGMANVFMPDLDMAYQSSNPYQAILYSSPFNTDLLRSIKGVTGVAQVEGRSMFTARVEVKPGDWRVISLSAIPALNEIEISRIVPIDSPQSPGDRELLLERSSLSLLGVKVGDMLTLELPDKSTHRLRVAGSVHDVGVVSVSFSNQATAYVNPNTMEWLGGSRDPNVLYLTVREKQHDEAHVKDVAHEVQQKIEKAGLTVYTVIVYRPGEHPIRNIAQTLLLVLSILGVLLVFLSAFLVINTINALLNQHIRQIGVMKAVGARTGQVVLMYIGFVLLLGLLAAAISIPTSGLLGYTVSGVMAGIFNFDLSGFRIPVATWSVQLIIALVVPVLASLYPILHGTRITVREAISNYGMGRNDFGNGLLDKLVTRLGRISLFSRPLLISLRNTIRRKARLLLTLSTLTLGGAIFIGVFNLSAAFDLAIQNALGYFLSDVNVSLNRYYRIEQIDQIAMSVPGVSRVEAWSSATGQALSNDKITGTDVVLLAPPAGSTLIRPVLTSGRWLIADDENAIVIGNHMIARRPDLKVGDQLTINISGKEYAWNIVGVYQLAGNATMPILYVNREYLAHLLSQVDRAAGYRIVTTSSDPATQSRVAKGLETALKSAGISVGSISTGAEQIAQENSSTNILVYFLLMMALLIALVGGLGLMGTMGMNVLERTREIGVMRSVGASNGSILRLVIVEGLLIGVISWLLGALLAIPLGKLMDDAVGIAFITQPLPFVFSVQGVVVWLVIVLVLSGVASILPAWHAVRLTVRDVLAYE